MEVKALVLTGFGLNADFELQNAFALAGAQADRVHFNDVLGKKVLEDYQILAVPGGFAFADDIVSGRVFGNKLKFKLKSELSDFVGEGKLVYGVCNGFQILVKAGLLPVPLSFSKTTTLFANASGHFEDRWVWLRSEKTNCVWAKGMQQLYLPVRHGEGKFYAPPETLAQLNKNRQVVFRYFNPHSPKAKAGGAGYPWNPNGALEDIAGICDSTGRVFGLMPHAECFTYPTQHPRWTRGEMQPASGSGKRAKGSGSALSPVGAVGLSGQAGEGLKVFQNAVEYARKKLV